MPSKQNSEAERALLTAKSLAHNADYVRVITCSTCGLPIRPNTCHVSGNGYPECWVSDFSGRWIGVSPNDS